MKTPIGKHILEIQDSGAPRGERNYWAVCLNGVELYNDCNGKKANALHDNLLEALLKKEPRDE